MALTFNPFTGKLDFLGSGSVSAIGATGATGPSGGPVGATGSTGATGIGSTGATGIGATGATGVGIQGSTGATGVGTQGSTGATGFGTQGSTGATGEGATGATGVVGNDGATGATGVTGNIGATGLQGVQGIQGLTGSTGDTGLQGSTGATGVVGGQGSTGATGVSGNDGATGATGATGVSGTDGATGATGIQGDAGATGATGLTGDQGSTGATGVTGGEGATGSTGATGVGADGATGATGVQGATGATGAVAPGGSVGAVDNAILRADVGTGIVQNSGLIIDDAIVSFAVTGDATTDVITATGSAFANNQPVRFTTLTGGTGLNTTTNYYVINASGATFQVSTSEGGAASLFTTNITAGTLLNAHSVQPIVAISENTSDTNSALVLTPKGTGAFILGPKPDGTATGGNTRGANAVDLQISRTASTQVASAANSFVAGLNNTTSANNGNVAIGVGNTASGAAGSIAIGNTNSASNASTPSVAFGWNNSSSGGGAGCLFGLGNTASANFSQASGERTLSNRYGMDARASGRFAADGDAQRARFVLRCKTTTSSAVEMALDGATTYLGISSGKVIACTINISGVKSDGSAVSHYIRQYAVKNVGGTSSQVYAPVTIGTDNAAGTSIALSANNGDDTLRIAVTGIAAETWRWVASVDAVEIAYGT